MALLPLSHHEVCIYAANVFVKNRINGRTLDYKTGFFLLSKLFLGSNGNDGVKRYAEWCAATTQPSRIIKI